MKGLICAVLLAASFHTYAQTPYTFTKNGDEVILNGIITKYILMNDPVFSWYPSSQQSYTVNQSTVDAMSASKGKVKYIIFGGTWCSDTQFILPKFFKMQEQAGVPDTDISFFAMDRSKKTIGNIGDALGITNVPTIIVMKDGKEVGRVVEYGTTGQWDAEIGNLLK